MRRNYDIIVINVLALAIGIILYDLLEKKIEILAATIATGISLALGIRNYNTENDKLFKELFSEFNLKYAENFNDKLLEIVKKYNENNAYKLVGDEEMFVIEYLNFCSEEYLWYSKNRIPKIVWESWENGMIYFLCKPPICSVCNKEMKQKDSYYKFFEKIERRLQECCN